MRSPYSDIDRTVDTTFSLRDIRPAPLTVELIREGARRLMEMSDRPRPPDLLPAGLYEIVKKHGWGAEALRWFEERSKP